MTLKKTLLELKKVMDKWGLKQDDWTLFLHYCDIMQGYNIKYARDDHLHIMVRIDKIPWKVKKSAIDLEAITPPGSKYDKDFANFIKKTGYDFHILVGGVKYFDTIINKYSILYKLEQGKMRMATTLGNLTWIDIHMEKALKKYSLEVIARRLMWAGLIYQESKKKGDKKVEKLAGQLLKKYRPKDNKLSQSKNTAWQYYKKYNVIKGEVGYQGKVKGKVFHIKNPDKVLKKIKKDVILVAKLTSPKLVPQINSSKAVITDEGGRLSHAAIFCREFKIPCIVGTKIATEVLKDGDKVEVDAERGIVKKL